jgi:hypothetical protein
MPKSKITQVHKVSFAKPIIYLIQLLLCMMLFIANASFAEFSVLPSSLLSKRGSTTPQPLEVLAVKDQQASDDDLNNYIEFDPGYRGYEGIFRFNLPANPDNTILDLTFHANYRGPEKTTQSWVFQLLNKKGRWVSIADNSNVTDGYWSDIISSIKDPGQFINSNNQITLRYRTTSSAYNSHLDYLALKINGLESNPPKDNPDTVVTPPPIVGNNGGRWQPTPGLKWQIQYTGTLDTSLNVDVYNIDLFDTSATTIAALQSKGKHMICYFSAGSYENWRSDTSAFPASVLGRGFIRELRT